jgi:aryl-alcohol dehydrogenase-like predicted oxidoreductase
MRYRPVGKSGVVVSAISLGLAEDGLKRGPADWTNLIFAALENGINCFEVLTHSAAIAEGIARALSVVDRELIFIGWRLGQVSSASGPVQSFSSEAIVGQLRAVLGRSGMGYLDVAMLDEPAGGQVTPEAMVTLKQAQQSGYVRMLGIAGRDDSVETYMRTGDFDVLGTPFNLTSGWTERNWLRTAAKYDLGVFGYEPYPIDFHRAVSAALRQPKKGRVDALQGCGSYMFLDATHGWTAEEICLAFALTEPSLATVQLFAPALDRLERLAETPEREMPPGLSAQIEMARFSPAPQVQPERQRA